MHSFVDVTQREEYMILILKVFFYILFILGTLIEQLPKFDRNNNCNQDS